MIIRRLEGVGGGGFGREDGFGKGLWFTWGRVVFFFREGFNIRSKSFFCVVLFGRVLFYIWKKDLSVVIV